MGATDFLLGRQPDVKGAQFPWTQNQRAQAGDAAFNQIGGMYGTDPNAFWGGQNAWTTAGGAMGGVGSPDFYSNLFGLGGGGHATGYAAHGAAATAGVLPIGDESFQMLPSERIRGDVYGAMNRASGAQASAANRAATDRMRLSGSAGDMSSPAALAAMAANERAASARAGEGYSQFEANFSAAAGNRRASGLTAEMQGKTQASIATAGNRTSASIATAGNKTSASQTNAGIGAQMAGIRSDAALRVLGMAGRDEDRMLERYKLLNNMNMGWQRPVVNPYQQPGQQGQLGSLFNLGRGLVDDLLNRNKTQPGQMGANDPLGMPGAGGSSYIGADPYSDPYGLNTGWDPNAQGPNSTPGGGYYNDPTGQDTGWNPYAVGPNSSQGW